MNANRRQGLLDEARRIVTSDRNNLHGPPHQDFQRTADLLTALGFQAPDDEPLQAHHVAMILACVKLSRLTWNPLHRDNWTDLAGYAACGYEAAVLTLGSHAPDAEE